MITVVCAMNHARVIGRDGKLPWSIPAEMAHFKEVTMGKEVVMGRKTFDSIGSPLKGRVNHVLTRVPEWSHPGVTTWNSWEDVLTYSRTNSVSVIGGAGVYSLALPYSDEVLLSVVDNFAEGDSFFPELPNHLELVRVDERGEFRIESYSRRLK